MGKAELSWSKDGQVELSRSRANQNTVLDKSYLDGATTSEIHTLCAKGALVPDILFVELVTTRAESRRKCFAKFPSGRNPVVMIPSIGALLRYEIDHQAACTPLVDRRWKARFQFNEGLAREDYKFSEADLKIVGEIEREIKERVLLYQEASRCVESWFPEIKDVRANGPREPIDRAMAAVVKDHDRVRAIYGAIVRAMHDLVQDSSILRAQNFSPPAVNQIGEAWAWFRNLQAQLLAALEFVRKNGADELRVASQMDRARSIGRRLRDRRSSVR